MRRAILIVAGLAICASCATHRIPSPNIHSTPSYEGAVYAVTRPIRLRYDSASYVSRTAFSARLENALVRSNMAIRMKVEERGPRLRWRGQITDFRMFLNNEYARIPYDMTDISMTWTTDRAGRVSDMEFHIKSGKLREAFENEGGQVEEVKSDFLEYALKFSEDPLVTGDRATTMSIPAALFKELGDSSFLIGPREIHGILKGYTEYHNSRALLINYDQSMDFENTKTGLEATLVIDGYSLIDPETGVQRKTDFLFEMIPRVNGLSPFRMRSTMVSHQHR